MKRLVHLACLLGLVLGPGAAAWAEGGLALRASKVVTSAVDADGRDAAPPIARARSLSHSLIKTEMHISNKTL